MSLWTSKDAAAATGGVATADFSASGVSIDTRSLAPGDLFVALKDQRDGHDFIAQAFDKGASAALVTHRPEDVAEDAPLLVVPDVLDALGALGAAGRARMQGRVIAVTGSVGKTSTKDMLLTALTGQGRVHVAEASFNNHWGVPLTLARMPAETEFAVLEIGMNAPGEIAPLSRLARPHVALITTVAEAHLEAFGNIRGIAREKASIVEGLEPGGHAVLNRDVKTYPILARAAKRAGAKPWRFGYAGRPEYALLRVVLKDGQTVVLARRSGKKLSFKIGAPGKHYAMNALGALAAVEAAGGDTARAALALAAWTPPAGRGVRNTILFGDPATDGAITLIDESFNANPTSMGAALEALAATEPRDGFGRISRGRRVAILGDMLELGPEAASLHEGLAEHEAMVEIDRFHLVGPMMAGLATRLPRHKLGLVVPDAASLVGDIRKHIDAGDVVMVKASKGTGLGPAVDVIRSMGITAGTSDRETS